MTDIANHLMPPKKPSNSLLPPGFQAGSSPLRASSVQIQDTSAQMHVVVGANPFTPSHSPCTQDVWTAPGVLQQSNANFGCSISGSKSGSEATFGHGNTAAHTPRFGGPSPFSPSSDVITGFSNDQYFSEYRGSQPNLFAIHGNECTIKFDDENTHGMDGFGNGMEESFFGAAPQALFGGAIEEEKKHQNDGEAKQETSDAQCTDHEAKDHGFHCGLEEQHSLNSAFPQKLLFGTLDSGLPISLYVSSFLSVSTYLFFVRHC